MKRGTDTSEWGSYMGAEPGRRTEYMQQNSQLRAVPDTFDTAEVRAQEAEAMAGAAADLRARAFSLPPGSAIRNLFLRSAARYVAASSEELGPRLRPVGQGPRLK